MRALKRHASIPILLGCLLLGRPATSRESDALPQTQPLLEVNRLLKLQQYESAERRLREYLKTNDQSVEATYLLGYVLFRRNEPGESLAIYTAAARLQRPQPADFKIVGLDYVLLNDYPKAIHWLERSVAEDPKDAEAIYHLGRAYYVENSFEKARKAFLRALELDPNYAKAENNLGLTYEASNDVVRAEEAYRKAIEMGGSGPKQSEQPYLNLAALLIHADRNAEAAPWLDTAEQIAGKSAKTAELRGRLYLAAGKLDDAEAEFRSAIALNPEDGALHYLLGRVLKRAGKTQDAEREFSRTRILLGARRPGEQQTSYNGAISQ